MGRRTQLRALFRQYDFDDSGTLEREEVAALLRKLGAASELAKLDNVMSAMVATGAALDVSGSAERADLVSKGMEIPSVLLEEFESWWNARAEAMRQRSREHSNLWQFKGGSPRGLQSLAGAFRDCWGGAVGGARRRRKIYAEQPSSGRSAKP